MELFSWWIAQLQDVMPWLFSGVRYDDALVISLEREGLIAFARRRGKQTLVRAVAPDPETVRRFRGWRGGPVLLAVPECMLLRRAVNLPLAAERDLALVLQHEMDRLTPFRADAVFWTWQVTRRDRTGGRLTLTLLLAPKAAVASSLSAMEAAGLRAVALEVRTSSGAEHLPLQAPGAEAAKRLPVLAGAVCAALGIAVCTVPFLEQQAAIHRAEADVASLRPGVALVDGLRRRLADHANNGNLFAAESARIGSRLRAIAAVTATLPDDTYLTSFAMRLDKISFSGRSAAAARLIGLLAVDPNIRDPAFDAPVTRVAEGADLFSIRATLAP